MRELLEKRDVGSKKEPQQNSSPGRNYWGDSKTCTRAKFFAHQTDVRVDIRQLSRKDEERYLLYVSNKFCREAN